MMLKIFIISLTFALSISSHPQIYSMFTNDGPTSHCHTQASVKADQVFQSSTALSGQHANPEKGPGANSDPCEHCPLTCSARSVCGFFSAMLNTENRFTEFLDLNLASIHSKATNLFFDPGPPGEAPFQPPRLS